MDTKVNKAQEKRDKDNTNYINTNLRNKLKAFENDYLNSCMDFEFNYRKSIISKLQKEIKDFPNRVVTKQNSRVTVADLQYRINRIELELSFDATIRLNALNYAKKSYDEKVNRLGELLVKEGFGYAHFKVEEIKSRTYKLEFLISKSDKEVHARLIWVDGVEVCSHFRFITTTRKI